MDETKDVFDYQAPTEEQTERIKTMRSAMKTLRNMIELNVPPGRERALAITKLEECSMWVNKGIVFEPNTTTRSGFLQQAPTQ